MRLTPSVFCAVALSFFCSELSARDAVEADYLERGNATLAVLDKITARVQNFDVALGDKIESGSLLLQVARCAETPMEFTPEAVAFIELHEVISETTQPKPLFDGWIFASSPGLSALEHPVYDVWLIDCFDSAEVIQERIE